MAEQLIESLTRDFDPVAYRDEYREELLAMIERKAAGEKVVAAPEEEREPTKAPDLMAALEESIAAVQGKRAKAKETQAASQERTLGLDRETCGEEPSPVGVERLVLFRKKPSSAARNATQEAKWNPYRNRL